MTLFVAAPLEAQIRERGPYRLWIQEAVLDGRALVAVGRIDRSQRLPNGETVDRMALAEVLSGPKRKSCSVLAGTDAFRGRGLDDQIVFLDRRPGGTLFRFVDAVAADGDEGQRRITALRALLEASAHSREKARMAAALDFVVKGRANASGWVRRVVVREFDRLSRRGPDLFGLDAIESLRQMTTADLPGAERRLFRDALQRIERRAGIDWTRSPLAFRDPARRASFMKELAAFRSGGDVTVRKTFLDRAGRRFGGLMAPLLVTGLTDVQAEVRLHCVHLLGELEASGGTKALLRVAAEKGHPLREESLKALEKIAPLDAVPTLLRLCADESCRDAAWRILAAINTGEARLFLEDTQRALARDTAEGDEKRKRLVHLLSPAFQSEIARARDERRRRWRPDGRD